MNLFEGRLMRHHQQQHAMHMPNHCGTCNKFAQAPPGIKLPVINGKVHHPGCVRKEVVKS